MSIVQKEINNAYALISSMLLDGENVDIAAAAKAALRRANAACEKEEVQNGGDKQ